MNNLLQILAGLVIAVLLAIFAVPYFIDWNLYKAEIEAQASRLVGRPLAIRGDVNLRLLPSPYLKLDDIRIDAPGADAGRPALFEAKAFRLWLAAPPLLRGAIEVEQVELIDPVLRVLMDESGNSNWSQPATEPTAPTLPFTPSHISLESMKIVNGTLQLVANGQKLRQLDVAAISGDLSAGSLSGPFKLEGHMGRGADERLVRFNSGRIDDKGELRFKSLLRSGDSGERYEFDGSLLGLNGTPSLAGDLIASFPFLELPAEGDKPAQSEPLQVATRVTADAKGAVFEQASKDLGFITLVHRDRPQMLTGNGRLTWSGGNIDLDGRLEAVLVDLDQLRDGLKVGEGVIGTMSGLFERIRTAAARIDSGRVALDLKQIKLNNDLMQDIDVRLTRTSEGLGIEKLAAGLPGDNHLDINGRFVGVISSSDFSGAAVLRGQNLGRLVTWASGTELDEGTGPIRARPFTLRGDIELSAQRWALSNAHGDISDTAFAGAIGLTQAKDGQPGQLALQLTAGEIDTAALFGRALPMHEVVDLMRAPAGKPGEDNKGSALGRLIADKVVSLQLRAGRVAFADLAGQDLIADLYFDLNRLDLRQLSVRSASGLRLAAEGRIDGLEQTPSGSLTTDIDIGNADDLGRFLSWIGADRTARLADTQLAALAPLRLAVMLQTETGDKPAALIRVNGTAGASHIGFSNRVVGSNLFSRREPLQIDQLEITGTVTNDKGSLLLTQLVPRLPVGDDRLAGLGAGKLWLSAAGLPERGLASRLEFTSQQLSAGYDGRIGWQQGVSRIQGKLHLETQDATLGFALAGIDLPQPPASAGTATQALQLGAELDKKDDSYELSAIDGSIAGAEVQGRARLTRGETGRKLDLVLLASSLDVPNLFAPLLEGSVVLASASDAKVDLDAAQRLTSRVEGSVEGDAATLGAVVSSRRFDPRPIDGVDADLLFTADRLGLGGGVALRNGELSAKIRDRKIAIDNLGGELWGGRMMVKGTLDLATSIPEAKGSIDIADAKLEAAPFRSDGAAVMSGRLSLKADLNGRGVSPAGVLAFLNGKGELKIDDGKLNRFNPAAIDDAIEDELAAWDQTEDQTPFDERFKRHLLNGDMPLTPISQPLLVSDGILDFAASQENAGHSRVDLALSLALAPMNLHARFTIKPLPASPNPQVPAAAVLYEGTLAGTQPIEPKPEIASLDQHLKVMKMEHNVELLEKLHKQDEELARKAAEKREQQRLEQEQAATAAGETQAPAGETTTAPVPPPVGDQQEWNPFRDQFNGMR